eukprot:CAMPEP_0205918328 /NCGR_PEP_ID=MMETSP1325-20131115/9728_1 /ASSEMBLY_ACC=CAM_ASM_000708 /TAXON_ID=236786 /ORGANISM="Florenciella sp., Strain RCC1007" /LENGTH=57 /DNA_ID=CAMNT_0053285841 /DNA_START=44 /DNA_END=217 /DNA_ORIENTATION=+
MSVMPMRYDAMNESSPTTNAAPAPDLESDRFFRPRVAIAIAMVKATNKRLAGNAIVS